MANLNQLGEFEAIRRLTAARARVGGEADAGVVVDSGDDAAVVRPSPDSDLVATTDTFVEGRHFPGRIAPPVLTAREIGARLAVANLSDLAAMAARPRWALLSLGVRSEHEIDDLLELQAGLTETLAADGGVLVGGNLVAVHSDEWMTLTLFGETPRGRVWRRAGGRPGDWIAVTGFPGRAPAGARLAMTGYPAGPKWQPLLDAWIRPRSRVGVARALAPLGVVTAAVDISDGFFSDLAHLCEASGVGAEVDEALWLDDTLLAAAAQEFGLRAEVLTLGPSDDYELLLAIDPSGRAESERIAQEHGVRLGFIGRLTDRPGELVRVDSAGRKRALEGMGYDQFRDTWLGNERRPP